MDTQYETEFDVLDKIRQKASRLDEDVLPAEYFADLEPEDFNELNFDDDI